ncbi:polysaccharide biosynthesis protein [Albibacterium bauzanense]|uniref:FlaA1/EpsC-like NDP-sugar epimerase n=1 Tax=Albibacterium bauzanense TaxID=653929 RepID=A0A4R1M087_9SPHI|nr:nucleoside-diphosphate sugar epimerase/dehydratase [Albibacterium bauzanense]TCK85288.1 FlaA1/EpsC-like NDP-sugar epimerase [Albibacterium bauzanense]
MRKFLLQGRTLPRWVIFIVDLIIISWSFSFSYFIVERFEFNDMVRGHYLIYISLFCLIASPVIYFLRLHTGLLRYSNTQDMLRIFVAVLTFSIVFLVASFLFVQPILHIQLLNLFSILIINFFITSSLLIMLRIFAKAAFYVMIRRYGNKERINVLIYGSDKNAVLVKQALESNSDANYVVEGFIDVDRTRLNSYMEQKKVYHFKELTVLNAKKNIDQIIVINELLGERDKKVVIERALRLGIKVITVPPAGTWLSGKLDRKQMQKLRIEDLLQRKPIRIDQTRVSNDLTGKRVLVTGAAGSIGSEIVRQVLKYNPAVLILCDQAESPLHEMQLELEDKFPDASIKIKIADVRSYSRMHKLFNDLRPQVVYHAAAYKHVPLMEHNPFEAIKSNVQGTKNVADLAVKFGTDKFVMISTDKAVNPTNIMGASKRLAEIYIQALNDGQYSLKHKGGVNGNGMYVSKDVKTRFITTRFGNVLGSNGSVLPRFKSQIEKRGPLTVTHPEITRYFMTIYEAVQLVLEAGTMGEGGEIFVFDMGKPIKIVDLARKMIQLAGLQEGVDIDIVFSGLRPGEKLYEELLSASEHTLPTHHEKISIARVVSYPFDETKRNIDELLAINEQQINKAVVRKMKQIVPEFISKNSPYELLDAELEEKHIVT